MTYDGDRPADPSAVPSWMTAPLTVHFRDPLAVARNMLRNPDFKDAMDFGPIQEYDPTHGRLFRNLMSGE